MELKRRIFDEEHIIFRESVKRWVDTVMRPRKEAVSYTHLTLPTILLV